MCGIAGIVSNNIYSVQKNILQQMSNSLQHRGIDAEGFFIDETNKVGFAHRRLSVIDLSENATQPMHFFDKETNNLLYTIVYNGEIYNYVELREQLQKHGYTFKTKSDTEVILAAYDFYEDECIEHFDGMFAFAIWDENLKEVFAARDRFGEKPFYYFLDEEKFVFASEMKAIWATGIEKEINNTMLLNYITLGFVSNSNNQEQTFYTNIKKLPAASRMYVDVENTSVLVEKYWDIDKENVTSLSEADAEKKLQELLFNSVKKRLRSDVAIGTSLSGGLDSSSIIAIIQQLNSTATRNIFTNSFSAIFLGFEKDESLQIQKISEQFQLTNFTTEPTADDFLNNFDTLMHHQEEPLQSSSVFAQYKVYELAKQQNITVLLDGQGADEVFAGYSKYYHWYWQSLLRKLKFGLLNKEISATTKELNIQWNYKNYIAAFFPSLASTFLQKKLIQQQTKQNFVTKDFTETYFDKSFTNKPIIESLNDALYFNTIDFGLEELLRYADRNSMAHGREVRLPFLNHQLVEFVFSLPDNYKIQNGFTKSILRKTMQPYLPQQTVWRKDKVGFEPPQQKWMQHHFFAESINEAKKQLVKKGILQNHVLQQKVNALPAHSANNYDWWFLCAAKIL